MRCVPRVVHFGREGGPVHGLVPNRGAFPKRKHPLPEPVNTLDQLTDVSLLSAGEILRLPIPRSVSNLKPERQKMYFVLMKLKTDLITALLGRSLGATLSKKGHNLREDANEMLNAIHPPDGDPGHSHKPLKELATHLPTLLGMSREELIGLLSTTPEPGDETSAPDSEPPKTAD